MITVKFVAGLKKYADVDNNGVFSVGFKEGLTVSDILDKTDLKNTNIKYIIMVNGKKKPVDYCVRDNASIIIMPLMAGG